MNKTFLFIFGLMAPCLMHGQGATPVQAPSTSAFSFGGDLRLRNEYFNNDLALNDNVSGHEQDYFRTRARLWASYMPDPVLSLNVRLATEPRTWMRPAYAKQHPGLATEWRYLVADSLNAKWNRALGESWNLSVTGGRQDIQFGETGAWWLVADGTPGDGSWTTFFDALRVGVENKAQHLKFDFVALSQRAAPDSNMDIVGSKSTYSLTEQNEKGLMLYATAGISPAVQCDTYLLYKNDRKAFSNGDTADIYTLGTRLSGVFAGNWSYSMEAATQWGKKKDGTIKWSGTGVYQRDIRAWGANGRLNYLFKDALDNKLGLVFEYLSGDNPRTQDKDEMFDILWGRYPRWSDAYSFAYATETGGKIAQMNNLLRFGPTWSIAPTKTLSLNAAYSYLLAPQAAPTRATNASLFSFNGHERGQLFQLVLKKQFNKYVSGLICAEFLTQGKFYTNRETQSFLRFETAFRY